MTGLDLVPVTADVAQTGARLRAEYGLRTPDALHLAPAIEAGADVFLTNDERLRRVSDVRVMLVSELPTSE